MEPQPPVADNLPLIQIEFPKKITPFVWLAMATGLVLVLGGLFEASSLRTGVVGNVLTGSGIAIILAAFGGQATVTGKVFVFAGVAAIAAALIWFLSHQQEKQLEALAKQYVRGTLHNMPTSSVTLRFSDYVLASSTVGQKGNFKFIVFDKDTRQATNMTVGFDISDKPIEITVPTSCLTSYLGSNEDIDWQYQANDGVFRIVDRRRRGNDGQPAIIGQLPTGNIGEVCAEGFAGGVHDNSSLLAISSLFISPVLAETRSNEFSSLTKEQLDQIIADMQSVDASVRRFARDTLSITATELDIPAILDALRKGIGTYKLKLGITVALVGVLRRDKSQSEKISRELTINDRNLLLGLAVDSDETVRLYANELLHDLGDYFVVLGSFTDRSQAVAHQAVLRNKDLDAAIISTDDFSNLAGGYYAVVLGPYNKSSAEESLQRAKSYVTDAYIKGFGAAR